MRLLLLINLFFCFSAIAKFQCLKDGKIKQFHNNQEMIQDSYYCINHLDYKILSFSCLRNKNCDAITSYIGTKDLKPTGQVGTPADKKCFFVGGTARLISFYNGTTWEETSICIFDDQSFVSTVNSFQ